MEVNNQDRQRILTEVEMRAMELKFLGYEYAEIATKLKEEFPDTAPVKKTLDQWFYKNGKLHEAYEDYAKKHTDINLKEAALLWKVYAKEAIRNIITLSKRADRDSVKLGANQEILGRAFGSVPKIVYQPENKDVLDELLKEIGLLENEQPPAKKDI